ncbi:MAG: hypothetical protein JXR78_08220 [Victivallales bacterium]|nr:hypothetical protein [Victivallales bacterium]
MYAKFLSSVRFAVISITLLSLCGCGYQLGSLMHPQVKSIAISQVTNDTLFPYVSSEMRGALAEAFCVDGSLKVKNISTADCILHCKVTSISISEIAKTSTDDDRIFRAAEWRVTLAAEFVVIIPSMKDPLIAKRTVAGTADFQGFGDYNTMMRQGIRQAAFEAAKQMVEYTTEAW